MVDRDLRESSPFASDRLAVDLTELRDVAVIDVVAELAERVVDDLLVEPVALDVQGVGAGVCVVIRSRPASVALSVVVAFWGRPPLIPFGVSVVLWCADVAVFVFRRRRPTSAQPVQSRVQ